MMTTRVWRSMALGILLFGPVTACKRRTSTAEQQRPKAPRVYRGDHLPPVGDQGPALDGGELRVVMGSEPPSLNAQLDPLDNWGKKLDDLIYEPLARPNPKTWEHQPRLAQRWEISADKLTFTFYLRRGVTWHDGKPFTAADVVFTFDKLLSPTSKTVAIRSYLEPLDRYQQLDSHTVRFHLKRRYWYAFDAVAEIFIYPKHIYEHGDFNTHPANRTPVGIGRYRFVRWKKGDDIVLERYDKHFDPTAKLARLVFKYVPDPSVRLQMLRRGDVEVIERIPPDMWRSIVDDQDITKRFWRLRHVPTGLWWVGWNQERPLFQDRRVRRALTLLLDRTDIADNLRLGLDSQAASWFYPGVREFNTKLEPLPYDRDAAMELLQDAGWQDTDDDGLLDRQGKAFRFTFVYPNGNAFHEQLAGLMTSDYRKAGIEVVTSRLEWSVFMERLRRHEFDACSLVWSLGPRSDPYQIWHSSSVHGGSNFISFRHGELDRLLDNARLEFDDDKRIRLYHRLSEILHQEQPYTMLFNRYNLSLVSRDFGGIYSTPYGLFRYDDFYRIRTKRQP